MADQPSISGLSYADDVTVLTSIYDTLDVEHRILRGDLTPEELVRATIDLLSQGVFDQADLQEHLWLYLQRRLAIN
ncbi:hypothetical protein [Mesorhizobium sp. 1M-11]|uniref:hypothetical protein n=1 Tax=Mesorhizobium sp. 1M-11 TaxID=1529006 RepID=UPI000ACF84B9|nr:hypothetical protein [Mesorhizobium sp. 1M-11]